MPHVFTLGCLALAAVLASGCAIGRAPIAPDRVTENYTIGSGYWSSGGGVRAAVRVRDEAGRTAICGAWRRSRQSTESLFFNEDVIEAGIVFLGNEAIIHNLSFMIQAHEAKLDLGLTGEAAGCVLTERPWQTGDDTAMVTVRFPRMVFGAAEPQDNRIEFRQAPWY